jgi:hypothetical protein
MGQVPRAHFRPLAQGELEYAVGICAPLFWYEQGQIRPRNGTTFFLRLPTQTIGVTAAHVVDGWLEGCSKGIAGPLLIAGNGQPPLPLGWDARRISHDNKLDIATYRFSEEELTRLGKFSMHLSQEDWPCRDIKSDEPLAYAGYAADATRIAYDGGPIFGAVCATDVAHSVNNHTVSVQLIRENLVGTLGDGVPPENFNFGGISGGVLLRRVDNMRPFRFGGVIYQGPNTSQDEGQSIAGFEVIRARLAKFLHDDGTLDRSTWEMLK